MTQSRHSLTPERPVLRYFGGKWILAPWIIEHFPPHKVYCEPFGGAGSVLIRKPRSYAEVYNDLDGDVVNLFRVLQDPVTAEELERRLSLTPFARTEFDKAYEPTDDQIDRARRLIIRAFMGFGSDGHNIAAGKTGFRSNSNRSGTTPAHDWSNWPENIKAFTQRLAGVVIENRDAKEVMAQQDGPNTLHFVDPPYVHDTRGAKQHGYVFEMTDAQHEELLAFLLGLRGMVVLSGYEHPLYERLDWQKTKREAYADGAKDRIEVLWMNPAAVTAQSQGKLL